MAPQVPAACGKLCWGDREAESWLLLRRPLLLPLCSGADTEETLLSSPLWWADARLSPFAFPSGTGLQAAPQTPYVLLPLGSQPRLPCFLEGWGAPLENNSGDGSGAVISSWRLADPPREPGETRPPDHSDGPTPAAHPQGPPALPASWRHPDLRGADAPALHVPAADCGASASRRLCLGSGVTAPHVPCRGPHPAPQPVALFEDGAPAEARAGHSGGGASRGDGDRRAEDPVGRVRPEPRALPQPRGRRPPHTLASARPRW